QINGVSPISHSKNRCSGGFFSDSIAPRLMRSGLIGSGGNCGNSDSTTFVRRFPILYLHRLACFFCPSSRWPWYIFIFVLHRRAAFHALPLAESSLARDAPPQSPPSASLGSSALG